MIAAETEPVATGAGNPGEVNAAGHGRLAARGIMDFVVQQDMDQIIARVTAERREVAHAHQGRAVAVDNHHP